MSYEKLDVNIIHSRDQIEQYIAEVTAKQEYLRIERNVSLIQKITRLLKK